MKKFIFDVDWVFTDGSFLYTTEGKFAKVFWPHDADGIKLLRSHGIEVFAVSADKRGFAITKKRIQDDMGMPLELVSEWDRLTWLEERFDLSECAYMWDGIHDIKIFERVAFSVAPANAFYLTRAKADYITVTNAWSGAVLEAAMTFIERFNITTD